VQLSDFSTKLETASA